MSRFLTVSDVEAIHQRVIAATGGSFGLRDAGLLESDVMRPQATFGGQRLYPDLFTQAAALLESLTRNHPFVDGNKRTGFISTETFLLLNERYLTADDAACFDLTMQVATGQRPIDYVANWLHTHSAQTSPSTS